MTTIITYIQENASKIPLSALLQNLSALGYRDRDIQEGIRIYMLT